MRSVPGRCSSHCMVVTVPVHSVNPYAWWKAHPGINSIEVLSTACEIGEAP